MFLEQPSREINILGNEPNFILIMRAPLLLKISRIVVSPLCGQRDRAFSRSISFSLSSQPLHRLCSQSETRHVDIAQTFSNNTSFHSGGRCMYVACGIRNSRSFQRSNPELVWPECVGRFECRIHFDRGGIFYQLRHRVFVHYDGNGIREYYWRPVFR